jgi:ADP-heptose:LPS heptosyltransferase
MMRKTFIHHDGALGDLLLSLPAIALIRERTGFIHLAGRSDAVELLLEAGMIDEASAAGSGRYVSLYGDAVMPALRDFLSGFDSALLFTTRSDSPLVRNIASIVAETRAVLTIPPQGTLQHVAGFRLRQMDDTAGLVSLPRLALTSERMEQAREYLCSNGHDFSQPLISVHPGSGGARKCWPLESYCSLLERLGRRCDPFVLLFSGPAEDETISDVLQAYAVDHPRRSAHLRNAELPLVAALLSMSDLYIGNDSGVSHLAACMGTRSITIFGPTDPLLWKPLGNSVSVVQSEVECAPCGDDYSRGCRGRICLAAVSVESLYTAAGKQMPDACGV